MIFPRRALRVGGELFAEAPTSAESPADVRPSSGNLEQRHMLITWRALQPVIASLLLHPHCSAVARLSVKPLELRSVS